MTYTLLNNVSVNHLPTVHAAQPFELPANNTGLIHSPFEAHRTEGTFQVSFDLITPLLQVRLLGRSTPTAPWVVIKTYTNADGLSQGDIVALFPQMTAETFNAAGATVDAFAWLAT